MDTLEHQIILSLKSRFFDIIDTENGFFHYEKLLNEMLSSIKALTGADEITLYVFNEWKQEFFAEAATNPDALLSPAFSGDLKKWANKNRGLQSLRTEIKEEQIMIPLVKRGKLLGCMILSGESGCFHSYTEKVFQELSEECGQFLDKAQAGQNCI